MEDCQHLKTQFYGAYSMIGAYRCESCGLEIDPVVEHARKNEPHLLFSPSSRQELYEYINKLSPTMKEMWNKIFNP